MRTFCIWCAWSRGYVGNFYWGVVNCEGTRERRDHRAVKSLLQTTQKQPSAFLPPFFPCLLKGSGFLFVFPALVIRSSLAACWDSSGEWSPVYVFSMCGLWSGTPRPRLCACECLCVHAAAVQAGSDFSRWVWLWVHVCHRTGDQSAGSLFLVLPPPNALLIHSTRRISLWNRKRTCQIDTSGRKIKEKCTKADWVFIRVMYSLKMKWT